MKKNLKRALKAYYVGNSHNFAWMGHPEEGCEYVLVENNEGANKAKSKFWKLNHWDYSYLELKSKRCPENDRWFYEGGCYHMDTIKRLIATRDYQKYLEEFMKSNVGKQCYIYSGQWGTYWREDGGGYTSRILEAGIYDVDYLNNWVGHCGGEKLIKFELVK